MLVKILFLIFAHFIGDWGLQSEWMATNKDKYWIVMFAHCMIWAGCVSIMADLCHIYIPYWKILFLVCGHMLIDAWKCWVYWEIPFCQQKTCKHLYIDQVLHIVQVVIVGIL